MTHMLKFFEALFNDMPDLQFDFSRRKKRKVIVYTDASFDRDRNGLGFIVFDQESNERFVCDASCPHELMARWNDVGQKNVFESFSTQNYLFFDCL